MRDVLPEEEEDKAEEEEEEKISSDREGGERRNNCAISRHICLSVSLIVKASHEKQQQAN